MIRLIFLIVLVLPFFLLASLAAWICGGIVGLFNKGARDRMRLSIAQTVFRLCLFVTGTKVIVKGRENLLKDRAVVYAGNHRSQFDILNCLSFFPRVTGFITKIEMRRVPIIGWWVKVLGGLFVDRESVKSGLDLIDAASEHVKAGTSLIFFCEGRLNKTEEPTLRFKRGAFVVAEKARCPIIPMTQNGTAKALSKAPLFYRTRTVIEFGKPIYTENMSEEELKELPSRVQQIVADTYVKNLKLTK